MKFLGSLRYGPRQPARSLSRVRPIATSRIRQSRKTTHHPIPYHPPSIAPFSISSGVSARQLAARRVRRHVRANAPWPTVSSRLLMTIDCVRGGRNFGNPRMMQKREIAPGEQGAREKADNLLHEVDDVGECHSGLRINHRFGRRQSIAPAARTSSIATRSALCGAAASGLIPPGIAGEARRSCLALRAAISTKRKRLEPAGRLGGSGV